jgi:hypothetical protein
VLVGLAFATTHEGWDVWLIGGNHRWATGAILLLGLITFAASAPPQGVPTRTFATLAVTATALARLAFASGSLTVLPVLVVVLVVVWAIPAVIDVWHSTHHPMPT